MTQSSQPSSDGIPGEPKGLTEHDLRLPFSVKQSIFQEAAPIFIKRRDSHTAG